MESEVSSGRGFGKLMSPIRLGSMTIKNRIAMAPMGTNYPGVDGSVNERFHAYIRARALGGVGLIILEAAHVHPSGKVSPTELSIDKDEMIKGLKELVEDVHKFGTKISLQLGHAGRQTHQALTGRPLMAPSSISCPLCREVPVEMTVSDIEEIVAAFGDAARRAKSARFDAVEIHGAHGYLVNQFLSSYSNKRADQYGGSLENRARFPLAVLKRIKEKAGRDFPVVYRMSSAEFVWEGLTIEDTKLFARMLVENGVDAIHVSGGVYESAGMVIGPACIPQGVFVPNASAIREAVDAKVPILVVGRIKDPVMAENIIAAGHSDMVVMGRALLADENLPRKISEGRLSDIRRCIACNQGCIDRYFAGEGIACLGNPMTGRESEFDITRKALKRKKVLVIGGGPAGLETARVAALRGHDVVLYEKSSRLGGQMNVASLPPFKGEINDLTDFLASQVRALGVNIKLSQELTEGTIDTMKPDAVFMATGSGPMVPDIKGIGAMRVCTAQDILTGVVTAAGNVAVIGGGMVGCETSEFLADKGFKVLLVEMLDEVASDMGMINKAMLLMRLNQKNVRILSGTMLKEVPQGNGIVVERMGREETIHDVDTVVLAIGSTPAVDAEGVLMKKNIPFRKIGDCLKTQKMMGAIHEGFLGAYNL